MSEETKNCYKKEFCVNQKTFERCLGYGVWIFVTIYIALILVSSSIEIQGVYAKKDSSYSYGDVDMYCYQSVFFHKEICNDFTDHTGDRLVTSIIAMIIDIAFSCYWINYKKKLIKLKWCEEKKT